jgi:hypothetical protein
VAAFLKAEKIFSHLLISFAALVSPFTATTESASRNFGECIATPNKGESPVFRRKSGRVLYLGIALGVIFASLPARAASITLQGTIGTDDAIQLFNVTVATAGLVDIRSYGYAGGATSTGTVVPRGGFDTILTLFSASGVFIDDNDDGAGAAVDPITGQAADARITGNLAAGSYILALTQYDNFSIGNLTDGFGETGNPNFTTDPGFGSGGACPGNMFRDISGTAGRCRTGVIWCGLVGIRSRIAASASGSGDMCRSSKMTKRS